MVDQQCDRVPEAGSADDFLSQCCNEATAFTLAGGIIVRYSGWRGSAGGPGRPAHDRYRSQIVIGTKPPPFWLWTASITVRTGASSCGRLFLQLRRRTTG